MTLPKDELKRRNKKFKKRKKRYSPPGVLGGGAYSAHPGLSMGEADTGLLDTVDWDKVPDAVKSAMMYQNLVELRRFIRKTLAEVMK